MHYQTIPQQIQAIQWTGENRTALQEFHSRLHHGNATHSDIGFIGALVVVEGKGWRMDLQEGDWLIHHSSEGFGKMNDEKFHEIYQPIAPAGSAGLQPAPEHPSFSSSSLSTINPPPSTSLQVKQVDGLNIVHIPILLEIPVDPLDGFTDDEAPQVALERLAELELVVSLGGVLLEATSPFPLFADGAEEEGG
jgi:hypothetical protein